MSDIIDYRPIRKMLEEARDERVNGFTKPSKEDQAIIDHIDSVLDGYERILEDLEPSGLADVSADLDELSVQGVDILVKIQLVADTIDADDLVKPVPLSDLDPDNDDEETESEED